MEIHHPEGRIPEGPHQVAGRARHLEEIGHTEAGSYADPENLKLVQEKARNVKTKQFKSV